jgi:hypothetical protein
VAKKNLIMPEPTNFLNQRFAAVSIIRPTKTAGAAMGAVHFLAKSGPFRGQSTAFLAAAQGLAEGADEVRRGSMS